MSMSKCLPLLVVLLSASPPATAAAKHATADAAEDAYRGAAQAYYVLKGDSTRRKFRHQWLSVVQKFEAVATKNPKSARAPDALFSAAGLLAELSRISLLDDDLRRAVNDYQKVIELAPKHRLADDSAFALGRIYVDRLDQPAQARKVLSRALELTPKGDQARQLKSLLASLPAVAEQKPVAKTVAARITVRPPPPQLRHHPDPAEAEKPSRPPTQLRHHAEPAEDERPSRASTLLQAIARIQNGEPVAAAPEPEVAVGRPANPVHATAEPRGSELALVQQAQRFQRVVIDAGHGGHDSGAVGKGGVKEKDVTLAIAKRVADMLADSGLEVVLTRDDDRYIKLEDRARLANEARGDLFISIHCNSAHRRTLRGIETYTLNTASDRYSIRLAARENSSSERGISDLQFILADLNTKANTDDSSRLASRVQRSLVSSLSAKYSGIRDLGNKAALFYVLLGARMPAILVETSFLSHPEEELRLGSRSYQSDVARAITEGVEEFLGNSHRLAKKD